MRGTVAAILTLTPPPTPRPSAPDGLVGEVVRVIDGDTVDVVFEDGTTDRVRLLGVDTPETFGQNKAYEYGGVTDTGCLDDWGSLATEFAIDTLAGLSVALFLDPLAGERGYYGRLLAYVHVDGQDFNAALVEHGYARVYTEGDSSREEGYLALQRQAQNDRVGLWECEAAPTLPVDSPLRYDPFGPDRDCGDFTTWEDAQAFYKAAGGPAKDPHRLDGDRDSISCESLLGAP